MNNLYSPSSSQAPDPAETRDTRLICRLRLLRDQTADAIYEIDRTAMLRGDHGLRCYLNALGTDLETFAAQLESHFPDGSGEVDLGEWADVLAVLSSACGWFEEQLLEIRLRLGSERLADQLRDLADSHSAMLPEVIAARFGTGGAQIASVTPARLARPAALAL